MKYQFVKQHSKEDCGAACLAAIAKYYGRTFTLSRIREAVGTGQFGTTLLGLKRGAETLGFNARPVKTSPEVLNRMNEAPLPAIIHWKGNHWVVLYGKKGKKCLVADPAVGVRYLSPQEIAEGWTDWLILLLEPDPIRFFAQDDDKIGGFWRFFKRVWIYRAILAQVLPLNLTLGLLSLASPFLLQILTDDVLVRGDTKLLTTVAIAVVVMNVVSRSLSFVQSNLIAHFAQRLQLSLVLEFGRQILRLPLSYYEARRSGEIVSRLRDISQINQLVASLIISLPSQFFIAVISFSIMVFYSWKLTVVAVFIAMMMSVSTIVFQPTLRQKTRELLVQEAEVQGVLVETFKGALTLKTTTSRPQFWDEFQSRFSRLANVTFSTIQIGIINNTFSGLVAGIGGVILLWFGGNLVINPAENLSIGQLLAFNSMNGNFLGLIATLISFVEEFTRAKTATQRLTEVIDATAENEGDEIKAFAEIRGNADIVCTNINFHYAGRLDLIDNFSLTIPGGKVVAIIGKSGCGKSTLAKLIAGLYPLQSGNIRIGLYNIQDLSLDCLRQQVVLVPQEPHFWSRSIVENFRLGAPHVTFEQIVRACQVAEADEFINNLPEKYQTILGEFGANLSGGQRQRLAIARAIVTDPPVLILDESTGGLDPVSEAQVLDKLFQHRRGKTTILITHRPKVVNRADWIVLLDRGKLKLQGSLEDLRTKPGDHIDFLIP
ncbi:ABC transporter ATP-binding protein [Nostoc linckia z18]|uniref:ABC transporter ATP-binding protein n=2 Tax=Nostoc linckia TaxID=92942 RepID=A0A9Q5ZBI3_NOSLI|nr:MULTISPECIES: peptidase domain-containing ABC transporter [Nostoc]PHK47127.1 ABC transporter ATP-binding protein [Nostoc linckia z16]MBC1237788.1 peptidase domain-containing ABC transporter [Nostoc sp. 2RC]PHJ66450.1 ABC transporter ATP-binding protein [Nostoc linckia z1]PHJ71325.1 ABC transporter ATP-binding protein [Nostoc linckia z3]PHJ75357.1 ABC transporter ATP-binding protein [Nostoc linckia z2]